MLFSELKCNLRLEKIQNMEDSLLALWQMVTKMTPFLFLGFLFAGILHVAVPKRFFTNYLSQNSFKSVFLAALFGIPLPLCSCGVLPTAMSLRKEGASKGATTAFLTATPQTGIDSILATYSVFGLAFTIIRPIAALVTSLFSGCFVTIFDKDDAHDVAHYDGDSCGCEVREEPRTFWQKVIAALRYGYFTMLQDIGGHLMVGLIIAGIIAIAIPDSFLLQFADNPLLEMLAVTIVAIPMYVCATGSIPIAAALMLKGLSPGAALVFLMAGPAVNFASMIVIKKVMGMKSMLIYILSIVIGACTFGLVIDLLLPAEWFRVIDSSADCCAVTVPVWKTIATIAFLLLVVNALVWKHRKQENISDMNNSTIFIVGGMSCNHCKNSVETNLAKLSGVTSATADLATGEVVVEGSVSADEVKKTIESIGFEYKGIKA